MRRSTQLVLLFALIAASLPALAADLTITQVDGSDVFTDCQTLETVGTVEATVKNAGISSTGSSFTVTFFEDHNGNGSYEAGTDLFLGSDVAGPLAPGAEATVSSLLNDTLLFAGNLIYAFADSADVVAETDETNNLDHTGTACQFEPEPGPFSLVEEWNWNSSTTYPSHRQVMMTPIVASITDDNGDGSIDENDVPDVIFSTFAGGAYDRDSVVRAVHGDTGIEIFTTPLTSSRDVLGEGSIAVGDIDGDGMPEIIAVEDISETHSINSHGRYIVFEHDGTFKFTSALIADGRLRWGGASLADLNGDGTPEIVSGRHILDNTGAILASGNSRKGDNGIGPLSTVADIDRDGNPDIVAGFTVYDVTLDGSNNIVGMSVKWEAHYASGSPVIGDGFPGVANFDADDKAEVVVVSAGSVYLMDDDGQVIWGPVAIPGGGRGGAPNIDDFDNDGAVEVGTAGGSRYAVYDTNGSLLWSSVTFDSSSNVTGSSVFDFEKDGSAEVIYKDQTFLRVYRGSDGVVLASVATGSGTTYENPVIADVDKDGNAEIIICANNYAYGTRTGIQVFGDSADQWVNTRRIWNQHTYHVTNVNEDATIPAVESDNWLTFNSFRSQEEGDLDVVFAAPDLTASALGLDTAACPGTVGLTALIGNGGSNVAGAPVDVAFYDGDPNSGGTLIGVTQTSVSLNPGESEQVAFSVSPPLEGAHTICAVADDDGAGTGGVSECDETNNMCCTEFDGFCVVCEPDPASQGYWHRQCLGLPASEGGIDPGRNGRGPKSPTEAGFADTLMPCAETRLEDLGFYGLATCEGMDADPPSDSCERALKQLTALILNVCSDRLQDTCPADASAEGCSAPTVDELIDEIAGLIHGGSCQTAGACAAATNEGDTVTAGGGGTAAPGDERGTVAGPGTVEGRDGRDRGLPRDHRPRGKGRRKLILLSTPFGSVPVMADEDRLVRGRKGSGRLDG